MSLLKIISTHKQVDELIKHCKKTGYASVDFETTGKNFRPEDCPTILGVSFQIGGCWIIPLNHFESPFRDKEMGGDGSWKTILQKFGREVVENPKIIKIAHNLKFEYKWFKRYGIRMMGRLFDTMLAKYLLDEERPHDLKSLVQILYPKYAHYEDALDAKIPWDKKPMKTLAPYCGIDTDLELRIMCYLERRLMKLGFYNLFRNLLMMASRVLGDSEFEGMLVDRFYLEGLIGKYNTLIKECSMKLKNNKKVLIFEKEWRKNEIQKLVSKEEADIEKITKESPKNADKLISNRIEKIARIRAGNIGQKDLQRIKNGLNFGSPKQLIEFFYTSEYGLKFKILDRTDKGNPSTAEETLLKYKKKDKTGIIDNLIELRGLEKLQSTYITGIHEVLMPNDRVHGKFHIHGTVTGRLSSSEPNLQNIPRVTTNPDIKRMFIAPPGMVLLEVDYSQAELRVVAEEANDEAMIDIFRRNYNIHVATACKKNKCLDRYDEIKKLLKDEEHPDWLFWEKEKKKAKTINFGILYEQGDEMLAEGMGVSVEEAKEFKAEWFKMFPAVKKWMDRQHSKAKKDKFVRSMWGRKRRLYNVDHPEKWARNEALRQAVNTPIQSAASDFALFSTVVLREMMQKGEIPYMQQCYTVHDSIGYYVKPELLDTVVPIIIKVCANPQTKEYFGFELTKVWMKVSPEVGISWGDLEEWEKGKDYSYMLKPDYYAKKHGA